MGLRSFLSAAFSTGTLVAEGIKDGIAVGREGIAELGNVVEDWKKNAEYEREKEKVLERLETDIYYAKRLKELEKKARDVGITNLKSSRETYQKMEKALLGDNKEDNSPTVFADIFND